ncbi:MAG: hypothetical protein D6706_10655 [Chloroflexi bacterium]|nr:MAG: hypothetical protein D6706_10655 [Chloroflexota bacterium]
MLYKKIKTIEMIGIALLALLVIGCAVQTPQFTYQGRLTDANGEVLDGQYTFIYSLYNDSTGGDLIYTEKESNVSVENGLFSSVIGPDTIVSGLEPEDLAQPLWLEIQVSNGTITETLTPRQKLYGAPYALTLMPGAVVSQTVSADLGLPISGMLTLQNRETSNPVPALYVYGDKGIVLNSSVTGEDGTGQTGTLYGPTGQNDDLSLYSEDGVYVYLDIGGNSGGAFEIVNGVGTSVFTVNENGDYTAAGTKSAVVAAQGGQRLVYTIESPEVWLEDFGSGQLQNGVAQVVIDPVFASSVDLNGEYHVFLTPLGDSNGLYVANKTATGFEVRESGGGTSNIGFDYRIVAHRAGYESLRMPLAEEQSLAEEGNE